MSIKQIAIAIDQLGNALIGGWADESISARAFRLGFLGRNWLWGFAREAIDLLFFWQEEHCRKAYYAEKDRRQLPVEYRE